MHFHLPKPLHGWREFAGEVGIIVIGVLIALGAEQVIETLHWRSEVDGFRSAVRQEVAGNLGTYEYRMGENGCVKERLDELEQWLNNWRSGRPNALTHAIGAPQSASLETSVWESRDANIVSHMPMKERIELGTLYDEFANNDVHRLDERQTWLQLADFDGATELDHTDLMRLRGLITRARYRDHRMTVNTIGYFRIAKSMGIRPEWKELQPYDPELCKSILRGTTEQ
jgi:hypothetical protein